MTESQSPQDGSFAAPRNGGTAGTEPFTGSYLDSRDVEFETAHTATTGSGTDSGNSGKVDAAKQEAAGVASVVGDAAGGVVDTAKTEAGHVAQEVKVNARQLLHQTKGELTDQAQAQQQRVADGLRSISDELSTMAKSTENGGVATDLVQQAAQRSSSIAQWLDGRDPGSLLDEVKGFARRKPGTFLLIAAGAGILAGRLGRGMADNTPVGGGSATGTTDVSTETPRAVYYPSQGGAVTPPAVDLPGPTATTAGYGSATTTGYDAGPLDPDGLGRPDDPHYGGNR
ncbi:hypothetical protein [Paenarthrobacter ilicis]|uniref:ElaB/YqjD/DUF883 family membrane-anchored ribosome-binding protein n=1 Tax=Paenarthrobacter ilicis TaxID=43665 RepID=A0ABX0TJR4_9MICC|nr:hypothetical protein [Paenarthrobacter ilicis]MBM7791536.1 ElaB/YqjD/DUF883 family membrane-anchored ribosome-binding protein [Paenarthrobacter ilicis]NIJ02804.1 ElaB/YqjD/DUF883 family membrane-anchored ribosome-binding protein [Paenarthrobacter ilicis]